MMLCVFTVVAYLWVFHLNMFMAMALLLTMHAMNCLLGGLGTINLYFTAPVQSKVCHDVATEPVLLKLTGEGLQYATAKFCDRIFENLPFGHKQIFQLELF